MAEDILFEQFDLLADTPGGVQKLRDLILQLAVQGRLVPQDPNDPPASELLKEVEVEKQRLVREGKFKTLQPLKESNEINPPFHIPKKWVWCCLDDISAIGRGGSPRPIKSYLTDDPEGINWIKIGDSERGNIYINSTKEKIRREGLHKSRMVYPGDLILSNSMSFGFPYIINIKGCIHDGWLLIRTPKQLFKLFIYYLLLSSHARKSFENSAAGGVVQNLNADKVRQLLVPLPPYPEQHRIVTKVNQLMNLCDELEAKKEKQKATHARLNKSALQALRESRTNDEMAANWPRVQDNFRHLFTTPESVQELRSTILQLAVQGKLVPQNPQDEPASALLERIREEKHRLVKEGKIKRQKPLPEIKSEEVPFELPEGWEWIRLGSTGVCGTGKTPKTNDREFYDGGEVPFIGPGQVTEQGCILDPDKYITKKAFEHSNIAKCKDILMVCIGGSIGKCAIVKNIVAFNQQINCISPLLIDFKYLFYAMKSSIFQSDLLSKSTGSATPIINRLKWEELKIPLPPLSEQSRIVGKVDQLMAICDELESSLSQSQAYGEKLMAAVVENISGSRQEVDAKLRNLSTQSPDEVISSTNLKLSDTAPANPQPANSAHPNPESSTAGSSNPESDTSKSNNTAAAILAYMQPGEQYTRSDIIDALGLSVSAWNTGSRELKEKGLVVQTGEKRGARYRLSERER